MRRLIVTLQIFTISLAFLAQGGLLSSLYASTKFHRSSIGDAGRALRSNPKSAFPTRSYRLYLAVLEEEETGESSSEFSAPLASYLSDFGISPPQSSLPFHSQAFDHNISLAQLASDSRLRC
jgi:hypothetical protein